jgi:hypothetical protein
MTIVSLNNKYGFEDVRAARIARVVYSVFRDIEVEPNMSIIHRVVTRNAATTKSVQQAAGLAIEVANKMGLSYPKKTEVAAVVSGWQGVNGAAAKARAQAADEMYSGVFFGKMD